MQGIIGIVKKLTVALAHQLGSTHEMLVSLVCDPLHLHRI